MTTPKKGEVWEVRHARKGAFTAKVISSDDEWIALKITGGRATMLSSGGDLEPGETLTVRRSLITFVRRAR